MQGRPRKPETAPNPPRLPRNARGPAPKLRRTPFARRRPYEVVPICRCPCLLPTHQRLPNTAKRPVYLAAPTRSDALCGRPRLAPTLAYLLKAAKHFL